MGPKGKHPATGDLFQQPLSELINLKHPLVKLAALIDWPVFETQWMYNYKHDRPNMAPVGVTPKQRLAMAA